MLLRRLFAGWFLLALSCFLPMLAHQSVPARFFGRYSTSYLAVLGVMVASLIISAIGWYLARRNRLQIVERLPKSRNLASGVVILTWLLLSGAWLFLQPGSQSQTAIALFRLYLVIVISVGGWCLLYLSQTNNRELSPIWKYILFVGSICLAIVLTLRYLGQVQPSLFFDEGGILNWAVTLFRTGDIPQYLFPERNAIAIGLSTWATLYPFGGWLATFGTTLESGRFFWLLIGWLSAPFLYLSAKRLYGDVAGLVALSIGLLLPLAHNVIRPDVYVGTSLAIALYTYLRGRDSSHWGWHLLTGFVIATAVEGHQYGARFPIVFGLLYLVDYGRVIWQTKRWHWDTRFWAFTLGGLLYFVIYLVIHIGLWSKGSGDVLVGLQAYLAQETALSGTTTFTERILHETTLWWENYLTKHPIELAIFLAGAIWALRQPNSETHRLVVIFLSSLAIFFILQSHYNPYYWVHNLPFIAIFTGGFLAQLNATRNTITQVGLYGLVALAILISANIHNTAQIQQNADSLIEISYEIDQLLPETVEEVAGWQVYAFGLADRQFINTETFINHPADTWDSSFEVNLPQAVILTAGLDDMHANIQDYLADNAMQRVACYPTPLFNRQVWVYVLPDIPIQQPAPSC